MAEDPTHHEAERIRLGRLPSGTAIETTVHRYGRAGSGPTAYLQALQHGREVNGLEVLRRVHDRLRRDDLHGQVVAVPVANPLSFDHRRYLAPRRLDALNANMNRLWPGDADGTLLERMVDRLWSVARDADVVVDLHTGAPEMLSHVRYSPGDRRARDLAAAFGLDVILADGDGDGRDGGDGDRDGEGESARTGRDADDEVPRRDPDQARAGPPERGKFREVASRAGVPTITPELAHSRAVVDDSVERGVAGVENVLAAAGVLDGDVPAPDPVHLAHRTRVFAGESGLFRPTDVDVGDRVEPGTAIGEVYDPATYEVLQTVEAGRDGMLLTLKPGLAAINGESLASVASVTEPP